MSLAREFPKLDMQVPPSLPPSLPPALTHSLAPSRPHALTHSLPHSLTHSLPLSLTHSLPPSLPPSDTAGSRLTALNESDLLVGSLLASVILHLTQSDSENNL